MLNTEEILIKLMQLLDFDMKEIKLKQSSEKKRFSTNEESFDKYSEHINLIFKKLSIEDKNSKLVNIFTDLLFLYNNLYVKLFPLSFPYSDKKLNWIILKRLVIPYLAMRFATLDSDYGSRIDKNLSGGRFWYLPDVTEYNKLKLPMEYLMNWWIDLYGKSLDKLCIELDEKNINEDRPIESKNTIKQWGKGTLPDKKSIEEHCSIELNYHGVFIPNEKDKINEKFQSAIEFVRNKKKISIENLKHEIPYNSLVDKIFITKENITKEEKLNFITFIKERWAIPSCDKLIKVFFIGRSVQDLYKRLVKYFNFKNVADIENNKLVQLIHHYQFLYNRQIERTSYAKKYNLEEDVFDYEYEYLGVFNAPFEKIIETLYSDITVEFSNPEFQIFELEDIYQSKFILFWQNKDERIKDCISKLQKHIKYFHKKFDDIDGKLKHYQEMSRNEKLENVKSEKSFECLYNLFPSYVGSDYELAENIVLQMSKVADNEDNKQISISSYLALYTNVFISENKHKYHETKHLCDIYKQMLLNSNRYEIKENEYLMCKAFFHFKAKEFDKSLIYWDEYYEKYIKNQKKLQETIALIKLAAYCAYETNNLKLLNKYNNYFIKIGLPEFKSIESLGFPIYFYN
ncbi:hypothetical protein CPG37_08805 [Malaciobacter canalis]|uniref:Uncharacterized protein n=1 Tax=Malaciobacter canalis TaxID=1912871 RepID=A0ABX4LNW1_9BACT|nr:hypothetical protein [Malaciobacter canalis]PHO09590.1 hypothetical protein CPG37_08805 [Malaciobacter canalis]QEE31657.1 hypothetical protein ACAN_0121 [Malaciobacter canalis]